jgi:MscS family membrane protein
MADSKHPLEPLDMSSPRATLNSFLTTGDVLFKYVHEEYWGNTNSVAEDRLHILNTSLHRMFNLREIAPAARYDLGRDGTVYLYEVLSRIELPPEADIPDAAAYVIAGEGERPAVDAETVKGKKAVGKLVAWTIPHTEITLVRVADGERAGQFLFSFSTVIRAKEFYEKVRSLSYRRDVPIMIILALEMIIFGAGKLPQVGSALGKGIKNFKEGVNEPDENNEKIGEV